MRTVVCVSGVKSLGACGPRIGFGREAGHVAPSPLSEGVMSGYSLYCRCRPGRA